MRFCEVNPCYRGMHQSSNLVHFMTELHTFRPKCNLLEWAEIPLGHILMENTHKGLNCHYIHKDSLHAPLLFSPIPVSLASKLHRVKRITLALNSCPLDRTSSPKLLNYRILWEKKQDSTGNKSHITN